MTNSLVIAVGAVYEKFLCSFPEGGNEKTLGFADRLDRVTSGGFVAWLFGKTRHTTRQPPHEKRRPRCGHGRRSQKSGKETVASGS